MDFDLIGGPASARKPYAMFERSTLRGDETIANEGENRVNNVQVGILERAFETDPVAILSFRLFLLSLATASAVHAFIFPIKLVCLGVSNSR